MASLLRRRRGHGTPLSMTARAMILGAGFGTRLRPLTEELPKPLVPVGDRPLVAHIALRLRDAGFSELVINVHHGAEHFSGYIDGLGVSVHLVREERILGTAGGIAGARPWLAPEIIVWNGDILAEPPIPELLAGAAFGGLCLAVVPRAAGEGTVGLGADLRVVRLRGEVFGAEVHGGDYLGVAALGPSALAALPGEGCLMADYALPTLRGGGRVAAVLSRGAFRDIGTLGSYLAANLAWLDATVGSAASWVHSDARVAAGVELAHSAVGRGAIVEGTGRLERCVVWPGARARAPLSDAIVTTAGRVVEVR